MDNKQIIEIQNETIRKFIDENKTVICNNIRTGITRFCKQKAFQGYFIDLKKLADREDLILYILNALTEDKKGCL